MCSNSDNGGEKGSDSGLLSGMQKMKGKQVLHFLNVPELMQFY